MRLGGPLFCTFKEPEEWAGKVREKGYRAALAPIDYKSSEQTIQAYKKAAREADIVIGEVGVWNNPLHPDWEERKKALDYAKKQLELAEKLEASCCVNVAGTGNPTCWYGPHKDNFKPETFDLVVRTVQEIIDDVGPTHTYYTLEPSPWLFPDTIASYQELIAAVDRKAFAVHLDPVNMMFMPRIYYENGTFLKECISKLGPYIKSCHIKDIYMDNTFTLSMQERQIGEGIIDLKAMIIALDQLNPNMPAFIEHMETEEEYDKAAAYVLKIMQETEKNRN